MLTQSKCDFNLVKRKLVTGVRCLRQYNFPIVDKCWTTITLYFTPINKYVSRPVKNMGTLSK